MDPSRIMQVGMGFWPAKTLLSAVELGVFTKLAAGPMTGAKLGKSLGLAPRGWYDFFDALVALGFLERDGQGTTGRYRNGEEAAVFLDRNRPTYIGGFLEMCSARLYRFWGDLSEGLRTGAPQNELKRGGKSMFEELYRDPTRLDQFMQAMAGISARNFQAFAEKFDFSRYRTLVDIGGATGQLSILCVQRHPHLRATSYDLPEVEPITRRTIERAGLGERVETGALDFFQQPIPKADVVTMGMILHDWNLEKKLHLIRSAYAALPEGGAFVAIENIIDDARRQNAFGLMMSLNMLLEFGDAFDFSGADFDGWCREVGFRRTEIVPLAGPASAAIAYK
ncbi:MAG TPA: methyltransferase [Polyangiales bacterium]|nr:methyltransferase [Polyangiales bacterium]